MRNETYICIRFILHMDDQSLVQVNITIKSGEQLIHFTTKSFSTSALARFIQTEVRDVDAGT